MADYSTSTQLGSRELPKEWADLRLLIEAGEYEFESPVKQLLGSDKRIESVRWDGFSVGVNVAIAEKVHFAVLNTKKQSIVCKAQKKVHSLCARNASVRRGPRGSLRF
eukprot:m51a1_g12139 hypothetical protein (108) ;mRNA; r:4483-4985